MAPRHGSPNMRDVLATSDVRGFAERLSEGMQTRLGENGALASGGEGQRIRFARTLMRPDARLVIFDEPFRGLDRVARRQCLDRARAAMVRRDISLRHPRRARDPGIPFVIVIEDGRIVEHDAPTRLAADPSSRYRAMLDAEEALTDGAVGPPLMEALAGQQRRDRSPITPSVRLSTKPRRPPDVRAELHVEPPRAGEGLAALARASGMFARCGKGAGERTDGA